MTETIIQQLTPSTRDVAKSLNEETVQTITESQRRDPFAVAMIRYLLTKEIPNENAYMRTRVLRVEDAFAVNESGILCKLWYRDPRPRNIVEPVYQVYVPEELRGAVI